MRLSWLHRPRGSGSTKRPCLVSTGRVRCIFLHCFDKRSYAKSGLGRRPPSSREAALLRIRSAWISCRCVILAGRVAGAHPYCAPMIWLWQQRIQRKRILLAIIASAVLLLLPRRSSLYVTQTAEFAYPARTVGPLYQSRVIETNLKSLSSLMSYWPSLHLATSTSK